MNKPKDTDEYIAGFPPEIQDKLQALRGAIRSAAPDAQEVISYGMPAYKYKGMLAYFAAHTKHIGLYPMSGTIAHFRDQLAGFTCSKGTVQLPFDQPMPLDLIRKMVAFRVSENLMKEFKKKK